MTKGQFISIEGIEGAGKSTALQFVNQHLMEAKINTLSTREPGGTEIAEKIRQLVLHADLDEQIEPETELLLMFAARTQHLKKCIVPALHAGKWVVCDRFIDASYAYQGGGRQIELQYIKMLDQWIVDSYYPDLTLLLDIEPEQGFARTEKRGADKDRIEQEKMAFFLRVRETYLARAKQDPERIKIIHAGTTLVEVENQIRLVLNDYCRSIK